MDIYLLKFSACLLVFWLVYVFLLERQKMHHFKRFYLLGSFAAALIIPLLTITYFIEPVVQHFEGAPINMPMDALAFEATTEAPTSISLETLLWYIYGLGVLIFSLRFIVNLITLYRNILRNEKVSQQSFIYVLLKEYRIPRSFFKYIFLNQEKFEKQAIPDEVLLHEETHAKQLHSLDIMLVELLQIVFWFHPLVYILKHHIKLNHEFLADQSVLNHGTEAKTYQHILLQFSSNTQDYQLSSAINYSSFKKRFTVMKTQSSKTRNWLSILLLVPISAILFFSFAEREYIEREITELAETTAVNSFLVTVEKNGNNLELKCQNGCNWSHLVLEPNSNGYIINDYGFSKGTTLDTDKFAFSIQPTQTGVSLNGLTGTAWVDLAFTLPKNKKQAINQLGMTTYEKKSSSQVDNDLRKRAEENYYKKQFFTINDNTGKYVKKRFFELDYNNKVKWVYSYEMPYTKIDVTELHFQEAKSSKSLIIKVNGNYVSKEELSQYKASDFITFSYTPISKLAKMKEESVLNLVTSDAYDVFVNLMINHYQEVFKNYEKQLPLQESNEQKDIKEIVSTFEFLDYNFKKFTPEIIRNHNLVSPTPISKEIINKVNQSYLDIPSLYIDQNNKLFLNNQPTSLGTIQKDFNRITNNQKSQLHLEAGGRKVHNNFVNEIMAAIGDNLINIGVANGQALIYDPNFQAENNKQNLPSKEEIASYNAWAKKIHAESKKLSGDTTWYPPVNEKELVKFSGIYNRMSAQQKKQAMEYPFPGMDRDGTEESIIVSKQEKATKKQIAEYNAWAKKMNKAIEKAQSTNGKSAYPVMKQVEYEKYYRIYSVLMTDAQRKGAEAWPNIPPPPPPPPSPESIKVINEQDIPPPPPPISTLDYVIKMTKKDALFFYESKQISSDKAIELVKKNPELNIRSKKGKEEKVTVFITKLPMVIEVKEEKSKKGKGGPNIGNQQAMIDFIKEAKLNGAILTHVDAQKGNNSLYKTHLTLKEAEDLIMNNSGMHLYPVNNKFGYVVLISNNMQNNIPQLTKNNKIEHINAISGIGAKFFIDNKESSFKASKRYIRKNPEVIIASQITPPLVRISSK